ncbi:MAG: tannase/feruloyl esterase family alpha/beta hydrolase [Bryobacteraceae bacterium]
MRVEVHRIAICFLFSFVWCIQAGYAQQPCESLMSLRLDHATVVSAVAVPAAPLKPQPWSWFPLPPTTVPAHCEVRGIARPSSDSEINFELWLPPAAAWNGKYQQRGNGGWAGGIPSWDLITPLARGYAAAATDDGHSTTSQTPDASFAVGHPEKLIDFGYRAVHQTALQSKAILLAYYGQAATKSYFHGCSDGGREALMEAQRFPEDFDGIVAGAPANNWTRHFTGFVWNESALGSNPAALLPVAKLQLIQQAVLAKCDTLDGVKDGLLEDPRACHFDPAVLKCAGADGPDCLTGAQVEAVAKIYGGPVSPRTGEHIYPGYEPGTEADPTGWRIWITGGVQAMFGNSFFADAVYENPRWDWRTIDLDRDLKFADEKAGPVINSYNPDLRSFRAHGGKLIQYHGWGDGAIAPRDSIAYYEKVQAFLKQFPDPRSDSSQPAQSFYRLFMVPGMGHCAAGVGPNHFGNDDIADPAVWPQDPDHDVVLALDRWVTQGIAPDQIIGTGRIGGDPKDPSKGVKMTRPLCAFPKVAHYQGTGDTNDAASFACVDAVSTK